MLTFITAITAGFLIHQFMSSLTERMKTQFPTQPLKEETTHINNSCMTVYIRSYASVNIQIMQAYVNQKECILRETIIISPGIVEPIHLYGTYIKGETYTVEIIPSVGAPLKFSKKYE